MRHIEQEFLGFSPAGQPQALSSVPEKALVNIGGSHADKVFTVLGRVSPKTGTVIRIANAQNPQEQFDVNPNARVTRLVCKYRTVCGMEFAMPHLLPKGAKVHIGGRDGGDCMECFQHQGMDSSLASGGALADAHEASQVSDSGMTHAQDGGKGLHVQSGTPIIRTEEGGFDGGDLGGYSQPTEEDGSVIHAPEDDPYGEGDIAAQKGSAARAQRQPASACPYKPGSALANRWHEGWRKTDQIMRLQGQ